MPPTKPASWSEIDDVEDSLKYDKRFHWLAGKRNAPLPLPFSSIISTGVSFHAKGTPPRATFHGFGRV